MSSFEWTETAETGEEASSGRQSGEDRILAAKHAGETLNGYLREYVTFAHQLMPEGWLTRSFQANCHLFALDRSDVVQRNRLGDSSLSYRSTLQHQSSVCLKYPPLLQAPGSDTRIPLLR